MALIAHSSRRNLLNLRVFYHQVMAYAERALYYDERVRGSDDPETAKSINNLALLYRAQGKYAEAEPLYQRALAICEHELGASHPTTQIVRQNYTSLLHDFSPRNEQH